MIPDEAFRNMAGQLAMALSHPEGKDRIETARLTLLVCYGCAYRIGKSKRHVRLRPKQEQLVKALRDIANGGGIPAWLTVTLMRRAINWLTDHE
jgi:hypothetical protein